MTAQEEIQILEIVAFSREERFVRRFNVPSIMLQIKDNEAWIIKVDAVHVASYPYYVLEQNKFASILKWIIEFDPDELQEKDLYCVDLSHLNLPNINRYTDLISIRQLREQHPVIYNKMEFKRPLV